MTYSEIYSIAKEHFGKEPYFLLKLEIITAVNDNLTYEGEDVEAICERILNFAKKFYQLDIDELVYRANMLIEDGEFDSVSYNCLSRAYKEMGI